MKAFSFGDISTSRYWLSVERKPLAWWRWGASAGPTYKGTIAGVYIATPVFVVLGHKRGNKS